LYQYFISELQNIKPQLPYVGHSQSDAGNMV